MLAVLYVALIAGIANADEVLPGDIELDAVEFGCPQLLPSIVISFVSQGHAYHLAAPSCAVHAYYLVVGIYHRRYRSDDPIFASG